MPRYMCNYPALEISFYSILFANSELSMERPNSPNQGLSALSLYLHLFPHLRCNCSPRGRPWLRRDQFLDHFSRPNILVERGVVEEHRIKFMLKTWVPAFSLTKNHGFLYENGRQLWIFIPPNWSRICLLSIFVEIASDWVGRWITRIKVAEFWWDLENFCIM